MKSKIIKCEMQSLNVLYTDCSQFVFSIGIDFYPYQVDILIVLDSTVLLMYLIFQNHSSSEPYFPLLAGYSMKLLVLAHWKIKVFKQRDQQLQLRIPKDDPSLKSTVLFSYPVFISRIYSHKVTAKSHTSGEFDLWLWSKKCIQHYGIKAIVDTCGRT